MLPARTQGPVIVPVKTNHSRIQDVSGQQSILASRLVSSVSLSLPDTDRFQSSCADGYRLGGLHRMGHPLLKHFTPCAASGPHRR